MIKIVFNLIKMENSQITLILKSTPRHLFLRNYLKLMTKLKMKKNTQIESSAFLEYNLVIS